MAENIVLFPGIQAQVIELRSRSLDELVPRGSQALQLAPAVMIAWIVALAVSLSNAVLFLPGDQRNQALPLDRTGHRNAQELAESGHEVDVFHLGGDLLPPELGRRDPDDQGDGDRGIIDEEAVGTLMVFTQALSMVADDDHDCSLQHSLVFECLQDSADQGIRIGDLSVVKAVFPALVLSLERLGGLVRSMGVIKVDPAEKSLGSVLIIPLKEGLDDLPALPLDGIQADLFVLGEIEIIIVIIEALADTPTGIQDKGADEGAGCPPRLTGDFSQSHLVILQIKAAVVPDSMEERIASRKHGGMGRQGQRALRGGVLE